MKFLITVVVLFISIAFAQAQDSTNKKIAHITAPKRTQQVSVSEFNTYAKKRFKTAAQAITDGESFIAGNFLVSMHQLELKYTLEKWKNDQEAMAKQLGMGWDASKYIFVKNTRYYIMENHIEDESKIWFFSEKIDGKTFSGFIKFKTTDRDEAYKYLNELLSNVEFKK